MIKNVAVQVTWLTGGWQKYKHHRKVLIVGSVILSTPSILSYGHLVAPRLTNLFALAQQVIIGILGAGWALLCLNTVRGDLPMATTIFAGVRKIVDVVVIHFLYLLIIAGGLILLVFPGFIWMQKYIFSTYFVMDKNMSPREALRASAQVTQGHKGKLFTISFLFMLLGLLSLPGAYSLQRLSEGGSLAYFVIGLLGTIASVLVFVPWYGMSLALAYEELSRQPNDLQGLGVE